MSDQLLAVGPPPLTVTAADAALDTIDFIAATIRGIDTIDVTPTMRALWRSHLAAHYHSLPPVTRAWYYNAPYTLMFLRNQWPFLPPLQQAALRQQWSIELPAMLSMLEPVLRQTSESLNPAISGDVAAMREAMASAIASNLAQGNPASGSGRRRAAASGKSRKRADPPPPPAEAASADEQHAVALLNGSAALTTATIRLMNSTTASTIDLMRAMNRR